MADAKTIKVLKAIGAKPEGKFFAIPKDMKAYLDAGLVEGNVDIRDPRDEKKIAWRLTEKGKTEAGIVVKMSVSAKAPATAKRPAKKATKTAAKRPAKKALTKAAAEAPAAGPSTFVIADFDEIPAPVRNSAQSKYPFDTLNNSQGFFVKEGGDVKDPSKSFGSMVSNANKKYKVPDDYRHFTARTMVLDSKHAKMFGHPVGTRGVAVFRLKAEDEAKLKAETFKKAK